MELQLFITIGFSAWFVWMYIQRYHILRQELGRFKTEQVTVLGGASKRFDKVATRFAGSMRNRQSVSYQAAKSQKEMTKKLVEAGLETASEQGKFLLLRSVSYLVFPLLGTTAYTFIIPYYATLITIFASAFGILAPMIWLKLRITSRNEEIQRELPLVLDLTNLGTSAGWDVAASLERVIDALHAEFPEHPLIRELKRARWLTSSGYTWNEALKRVSTKLGSDTVRRTTLALGQAIKQGGDRRKQLEGIAEDAQNSYYSQLDKRLASLPVKGLLATLMLMVAYFIVVLAPAAVQVKNILVK